MNLSFKTIVAIVALLGVLLLLNAGLYTVQMTEQAIVTQFGQPVGAPIIAAGLHVKTPFIQDVNFLEKRVMEWDGNANQIPTKDKLFIYIDSYARWRISEPLLFFQRLHDERSAQSRLDDILDGETRNQVAKHELIEIIRTDKQRQPAIEETLTSTSVQVENWAPIRFGREQIARDIYTNASKTLKELGIELLDIRFKRINYNPDVQTKIYDRMKSERLQIADKFRSEGQGEAARIRGEKERELKRIGSEAYKQVQTIHGEADARATAIYAKAYNQSSASNQFYLFTKTMETYEQTLDKSTMLIMSTGGDLFRFLKTSDPATTGTAVGGKP